MLNSKQVGSILRYAGMLRGKFDQKRYDPAWIRTKKERRTLTLDLLSKNKILVLNESGLRRIIRSLWAWKTWPSDLVVDEMLKYSDVTEIRTSLDNLLYGPDPLEKRLDDFQIKFFGPSSLTEIMAFVDPHEYALWNDKTRKVMRILEIDQIPLRAFKNSKMSGSDYLSCNRTMHEIRGILSDNGFGGVDVLDLHLFVRMILDASPITRYKKTMAKRG